MRVRHENVGWLKTSSQVNLRDGVLAPHKVIADCVQILPRTYSKYIVASAAGLMAPRPNAA